MSRSGQGRWGHLFVQQKKFEKAMRGGTSSFQELATVLGASIKVPIGA
jgi:hypothetical protein